MVSIYLQNDPLPTPISNCHPETVIVELLKVTVGVVGFNEPPEHNAAGAEIAMVGLSFTVRTATLLVVVPQPLVAV
jgi:hypothetical protein